MIKPSIVIPAQAGVQLVLAAVKLDPRLRGDDKRGSAS
jgi:hypothetical protein